MLYLIVSDTHGQHMMFREVLELTGPIQGLIHLGDSEITEESLQLMVGEKTKIYLVRGNRDHEGKLPLDQLIEIAGKKLFLTHGHRYKVDGGTKLLEARAKSLGAEVAMYGHTHRPDERIVEGLKIINPGSLSRPRQENGKQSYMLLEIDEDSQFHWTMVEKEKNNFLKKVIDNS